MKSLKEIFNLQEKVEIPKEYQKKEEVRKDLQNYIAKHARKMKTQEGLDQWLKDLELSITALKMVPLEAWKKV